MFFLQTWVLIAVQTLPICPCSLWCQLHSVHGVVAVIVHDLWQAKICDLNLPTGGAVHKQDVTWAGRGKGRSLWVDISSDQKLKVWLSLVLLILNGKKEERQDQQPNLKNV